MRTIALRFSDAFAPKDGTISEHDKIIEQCGYVWYGKIGTPISAKVVNSIMENETPKILLIHSGTQKRYWAYVSEISREVPDRTYIPSYYHNKIEYIKSWIKVNRFEHADAKIMSKCYVASSGTLLSNTSRHSMSPYFIIDYEGE